MEIIKRKKEKKKATTNKRITKVKKLHTVLSNILLQNYILQNKQNDVSN